jgi:hypothetical protein
VTVVFIGQSEFFVQSFLFTIAIVAFPSHSGWKFFVRKRISVFLLTIGNQLSDRTFCFTDPKHRRQRHRIEDVRVGAN